LIGIPLGNFLSTTYLGIVRSPRVGSIDAAASSGGRRWLYGLTAAAPVCLTAARLLTQFPAASHSPALLAQDEPSGIF
jgi:hypothetical protein